MSEPHGVVIVGAGLAGLRAAEAIRGNGYDGRILLVGDEQHPPYDRPPLSKQILTGDWDVARTALTSPERLADDRIELRLGHRVVGATPHNVVLDDGRRVGYDHLVVATGVAARTWPGAAVGGRVHRVRTLEDSLRLHAALGDAESGAAADLIIVGGGFVGLEVAAAARSRGCRVSVVELADAPLAAVLGVEVGRYFTRLHEAEGVQIRTGMAITAIEEQPHRVVVRLADGSELQAAQVVVGIGAEPSTSWLAGLGIDGRGGLHCDRHGRVLGLAAGNVWALGDVAAWDDTVHGDAPRHEHWTSAGNQAAVLGAALVGRAPDMTPVAPYFWSTQYDVNFQLAGRVDLATSVRVLEPGADGADRGTVFGFQRDGELVAVATFHNPRRFLRLRRDLQEHQAAALTV
ncbi:hypothetical protein FXB39_03700 [Nocardioides sp. BGMRC 2183]|nr:hypothetical protein FXB39_03700 [Nocardioides sp. BGMRC 2183]